MKIATLLHQNDSWVHENNEDHMDFGTTQLVIGFGTGSLINRPSLYDSVRKRFPNAEICLCSTAGEIYDKGVQDNSISLAAITFDEAYVKTVAASIEEFSSSFDVGVALMEALPKKDLKWVFVLSDGSQVNGSELVKGLNENNPDEVLITGGMAGDGADFKETFVGLNQVPQSGQIVAIGFYGSKLELSHGSVGGWESFGLEREVTGSEHNVLYEIDGKKALDMYKKYLGKYADELPSAALLFPLALTVENHDEPIVRTILSIDEEKQSMTFAGDIPVGSKVRFMKANFDRLVDAASDAAQHCLSIKDTKPKLAFLVSCVGRKLVLGNRIDEEIEAVSELFGQQTVLTGFYSYGEIAPMRQMEKCSLHNQTMTITGLNEVF